MTLRDLRKQIAPDMKQAEFARAMGYGRESENPTRAADAYRKYEAGSRAAPLLLLWTMQAMAATGWRPEGWPDQNALRKAT